MVFQELAEVNTIINIEEINYFAKQAFQIGFIKIIRSVAKGSKCVRIVWSVIHYK